MNTRSPDAMRQEKLSGFLKIEASKLGFDICRITRPDSIPLAADRLARFVEAGYPGTMDWIAETIERRGNPSVLWPEVRSIVMLGMNYASGDDPLHTLQMRDRGNISVYARNRDYHDVIKGKLKELAAKFAALSKAEVKVFVDTAPVMEKPLAEAAGIGWQGKHTNLVSRDYGSWLFLGSIFTVAPLAYDEAEKDHCGSCRACLDACPTEAFPAPYQIDARRCISYLTIEHKGSIPVEFRDKIGNRIYGCDDCLAACPWNKFAARSHEIKLLARPEMLEPKLADLLALDDEAFRTFFSGSPVKRIGRNRFVRNCLIAAGNSGDQKLVAQVQLLFADPDPYVRAMAIWALSRLMPIEELTTMAASWAGETDPVVLEEIERLRGAACM